MRKMFCEKGNRKSETGLSDDSECIAAYFWCGLWIGFHEVNNYKTVITETCSIYSRSHSLMASKIYGGKVRAVWREGVEITQFYVITEWSLILFLRFNLKLIFCRNKIPIHKTYLKTSSLVPFKINFSLGKIILKKKINKDFL